jgi:hypothetical protein
MIHILYDREILLSATVRCIFNRKASIIMHGINDWFAEMKLDPQNSSGIAKII